MPFGKPCYDRPKLRIQAEIIPFRSWSVGINKLSRWIGFTCGASLIKGSDFLHTTPVSSRDFQYAVWLYFRFTLSFRDMEDLVSERARWCSRVVIVTVPASCKCPFPIRGAAVQSVLGVAGIAASQGFRRSLSLA